MGLDFLQKQLRLPRRFTPRNDIILSCHCGHSKAISLNGPRLQKQLRLPRRFTPRNDIILFSHANEVKQSR